jgi:hypothetical protein
MMPEGVRLCLNQRSPLPVILVAGAALFMAAGSKPGRKLDVKRPLKAGGRA